MTIGIDISITSTGIVVTDGSTLKDVAVIRTSPKDHMYARSLIILKKLDNIITKYPAANIIIEAPAFMGRGSRVYQLFGLHFLVATLVFRHRGENFLQVPPTTLKKFATGNGRADKIMMLDALPKEIKEIFIKRNFKKTTGLYDLADAYHLAVYKKEI